MMMGLELKSQQNKVELCTDQIEFVLDHFCYFWILNFEKICNYFIQIHL